MIPLIISLLIQSSIASPWNSELENSLKDFWKLNSSQKEDILNHSPLVESEVTSEKDSQQFKMRVIHYHPKKCFRVIRTITNFSSYPQWISFVKKSSYNPKSRLLTVIADHTLLPHKMIVHVKMDKPKEPGDYQFMFPTGMFSGLKGQYHIVQTKKGCLFYGNSYWKGKSTGYNNTIIEIFSQTLTRVGLNILKRKANL